MISKVGRAAAALGLLAALACSAPETGPVVDRPLGVAKGSVASDGLVFVRLENGSVDLMRARLSDGSVRTVRTTPDRNERWPYWSDAAQILVFQSLPTGVEASRGRSDMFSWRGGAQDPRRIPGTRGRDDRWPEWAPDGRSIVYSFTRLKGGGGPRSGIAVYDVSTDAIRTIVTTRKRSIMFRPIHHPTEARWVVERNRAAGKGSQLWLLEQGKPARRLVTSSDAGPEPIESKGFFTRAGDEIVFSSQRDRSSPRRLMRVDSSGGFPKPFAAAGDADDHSARPSPTRDEVAFVSSRDGNSDLYLFDLNTDEVTRLTDTDEIGEFAPRWSPDGERIVISTGLWHPDRKPNAPMLSIATAVVRVIDREGEVIMTTPGLMPHWMPVWP